MLYETRENKGEWEQGRIKRHHFQSIADITKSNATVLDQTVQRQAESWDDYVVRRHGNYGAALFPYCDYNGVKATWDEPKDMTGPFEVTITLHFLDKNSKLWSLWSPCGHVRLNYYNDNDNKVMGFHTQSHGGNLGVGTLLFPAVYQWVAEMRRRGRIVINKLVMNPAGGAATKLTIGLLSDKLGDVGHKTEAERLRRVRKEARHPVPSDPNMWDSMYDEEFLEYLRSLRHLDQQGLHIASEGIELIGSHNLEAFLKMNFDQMKQRGIMPDDAEADSLDGEGDFEKTLSLLKLYLDWKAKNKYTPAGSSIAIEEDALELAMPGE